jgi:hypothetical protein
VNRQQRLQQRLEQLEIEGVGAVGLGIWRIVVDFERRRLRARAEE